MASGNPHICRASSEAVEGTAAGENSGAPFEMAARRRCQLPKVVGLRLSRGPDARCQGQRDRAASLHALRWETSAGDGMSASLMLLQEVACSKQLQMRCTGAAAARRKRSCSLESGLPELLFAALTLSAD